MERKFTSIKSFEISPLQSAKNNIFFILTLSDIQSGILSISTCIEENNFFSTIYNNLDVFLIFKIEYKKDKKEEMIYYSYIFQIPLEKPLKQISITLKKHKKGAEYYQYLEPHNIENFFYIYNCYNNYQDFLLIEFNSIISEYLDYFF